MKAKTFAEWLGVTLVAGSLLFVSCFSEPPVVDPLEGLKFEHGSVDATLAWTTVNLDHDYGDHMVVVCSAEYNESQPPLVVRVKNAQDEQFQVRLQRVDGLEDPLQNAVNVHWLAVNEGTWVNESNPDQLKMEARKFEANVTDAGPTDTWTGHSRSYLNDYDNPVVLGQVMSFNDPDFSVFWSRGQVVLSPDEPPQFAPPDTNNLIVGKHVGDDSDDDRAPETIGYVVFERTSDGVIPKWPAPDPGVEGTGIEFVTDVGEQTVFGIQGGPDASGAGNPPYLYTSKPLMTLLQKRGAKTQVFCQSGQHGIKGSWAVRYGGLVAGEEGTPPPPPPGTLPLVIDEDLLGNDTERRHTNERVSYLILHDIF